MPDTYVSAIDDDMPPNAANYQPLTPLGFLTWAATVYPESPAVIYDDMRLTYAQLYERCCRLAGALNAHGIGEGDVVAIVADNTPAMIETHYGVPMSGAMIAPVSPRKDAASLAYILEHSEAALLLVDTKYARKVGEALQLLAHAPDIIDIAEAGQGKPLSGLNYEKFLNGGNANTPWAGPRYEWQPISLNYTAGTEGLPRGVLFHHRGAFLDAISDVISDGMNHHSVYLWTLPIFRANGWCNTWSVTAVGGTHVCLREGATAEEIFNLIRLHGVTHLHGMRGFVGFLAEAENQNPLPHKVRLEVMDTNRDPQALAKLESLGFEVGFLYGMTETFGAAAVCQWSKDQSKEHGDEVLMAHPTAHFPTLDKLEAVRPGTLDPLPADGLSEGELVVRGNTVFKGYYKDAAATARAFKGGVFRTGDMGRVHPDGRLEITRRARDLMEHRASSLASGIGRVEEILAAHEAVTEVAVLPLFEEGSQKAEVVAFVTCEGKGPSEDTLKDYCREAGSQPDRIVKIKEMPVTEDGEICRYRLQEMA